MVSEAVGQSGAHGKPAETLDAAFPLFQIEGTGTKIPMQELPAPNMEIQSFLTH